MTAEQISLEAMETEHLDGAVLLEGSDQCRTAATELHEIKITLIGLWEKLVPGIKKASFARLGW